MGISKILCISALVFTCAHASASCPQLSGDYECVTSMSRKAEPWSLQQHVNAAGDDVYEFDNKHYVADGVERLDPNLSYKFLHTTNCTATEMVVHGKGEYVDRGEVFTFENQLVQYIGANGKFVSDYSHDGSLIDRMICTRR